MPPDRIRLDPRQWFGWQQLGGGWDAPWQVSPIWIEAVTPLKTGAGLLDVALVMVLRPFGPRRLSARLRVLTRERDLLVARWQAPGEPDCLVAITTMTPAWLAQHCGWMIDPPLESIRTMEVTGPALLSSYLGATPEAILAGAAAIRATWQGADAAMRRPARLPIDEELTGLGAWRLLHGAVPRQQEDRWIISREGGAVVFRRSWTGLAIYAATIEVGDAAVRLTSLAVSLDRPTYGYATPDGERARFGNLLSLLTTGRGSLVEPEAATSPRNAAAAWRKLAVTGGVSPVSS